MGGRLSKSSKYIDKLFKEQWKREGITPEDIEKLSKKTKPVMADGSVGDAMFVFQDHWVVDFKKMKDSHVQVTERNMERFKIKSASELLARASENIPTVKKKIAMDLTPEQDEEFTRLEGVDYAEEQFVDTWNNYQTFKAGQTIYSLGMNYAIYQIRVYGVNKKNQPKFDKLYKEVMSFFQILKGHRRRYYKEDLDKLTNEYLRAKTHVKNAIKQISNTKSKSAIYHKSYGATNFSMFGRQTVRELYKHIGVLDYLIEVNDKEKSIKNRKPNEAKDLEYFYYLCWEMYKLIDDSKFKVAKYDNQKLFAEYVYHFQSRFTSVQSKNNTYDNIRKNKKFTKLKYLDLQSIKTEATYEKKFQTLFGK